MRTVARRHHGRRGAPAVLLFCLVLALSLLLFARPARPAPSQFSIDFPGPPPDSGDSVLRQGMDAYSANRLEEALPLLRRASAGRPGQAVLHAWLGETLRRMGRQSEAVQEARIALGLDPNLAFAHTLLADATNPMYSGGPGTDADTSWVHLLRAVRCDPADGNAWISMWPQALRRGDEELERRALRSLIQTGFLTPAVQAYARWMLRDLPPNAVLLTNGDMDTYPAVALQEVEALRPDVAVVNVSLLNATWYARVLRDRMKVPLPYADARMETLGPYRAPDSSVVLVSSQIIAAWIAEVRAGTLSRPLTVALTVERRVLGTAMAARFQLEGAYRECRRDSGFAEVDTARAWASLRGLASRDFAGSFVAPADRSPIRRAHTDHLLCNIVDLGLRRGMAQLDAGQGDAARADSAWLQGFADIAPHDPGNESQLAEFWKRLEAAPR